MLGLNKIGLNKAKQLAHQIMPRKPIMNTQNQFNKINIKKRNHNKFSHDNYNNKQSNNQRMDSNNKNINSNATSAVSICSKKQKRSKS